MSCTFPELAVIGATPAAMAKAAALRNRPASPHSARSRAAVSEPMAQIAVRRVPQLCTNARDLPLDIEPASPWENGYIESFNGKLRDEPLNGEIFYTLREAEILVEHWRREYNHLRPHSSAAAPLRRRR
jgi:transposase InsO family protein